MNCKKGELARVIWSRGNDDTFVRCVRLATGFERSRVEGGGKYLDDTSGPVWVLDRAIPWFDRFGTAHSYHALCPDEKLRPIRGEEGADETLEWVEVPKVVAKPIVTTEPAEQGA
jgi:hypothetical protein